MRETARMTEARELDALVAERVMGLSVSWHTNARGELVPFYEDGHDGLAAVENYSTSISAAWQIVHRLRPYHFDLRIFNDGWYCRLCVGNDNTRYFEAYGGRRDGDYHTEAAAALAI